MNFKEYHGYKVWDNGVVISKLGKLLKQTLSKCGYLQVSIMINSITHTHQIHALVGKLFLPNFYGLPTVDHKDNNKTNNSVYNLRWASQRDQLINQTLNCRNTSGVKGVCYHKHRNTWYAYISPECGKRIRKSFKSKEDAIAQRKAWELEYYNLI